MSETLNTTLSPRRVPLRHGFEWLRDGWRLLVRKPLTWIVYTFVTWFIVSAAAIHPLLVAAVAVLLPVILAGWTLACREAEAGRSIPVTMLFDGFRGRVADLASIGGLNLLGNVVLMMLMLAIGGEAFTEAMSNPGGLTPEQAQALQGRMSLALVVILAIGVPLAMAVWFAPVAVVLDGQRGWAALGASLRGIARNSLPFFVYSLLLALIGLLLFSLATAIGLTRPAAMELAFWGLMPLLVTSVYASYRDIFGGNREPEVPVEV
ncbi:MAG: hypothetical protein JNL33_02015 [Betaproteobacteria bacterium]|nr:hypothetical protein [Betaproteobacteria bacterium]